MRNCAEVDVLPRAIFGDMEPLPPRLLIHVQAANGIHAYIQSATLNLLEGRLDFVITAPKIIGLVARLRH